MLAVLESSINKLRNKLDEIVKVYIFPCLTLCTMLSFWLLRNLSNHMDRQARTRDKVLAKSREMTGRSQTLPGGGGGEEE